MRIYTEGGKPGGEETGEVINESSATLPGELISPCLVPLCIDGRVSGRDVFLIAIFLSRMKEITNTYIMKQEKRNSIREAYTDKYKRHVHTYLAILMVGSNNPGSWL